MRSALFFVAVVFFDGCICTGPLTPTVDTTDPAAPVFDASEQHVITNIEVVRCDGRCSAADLDTTALLCPGDTCMWAAARDGGGMEATAPGLPLPIAYGDAPAVGAIRSSSTPAVPLDAGTFAVREWSANVGFVFGWSASGTATFTVP